MKYIRIDDYYPQQSNLVQSACVVGDETPPRKQCRVGASYASPSKGLPFSSQTET